MHHLHDARLSLGMETCSLQAVVAALTRGDFAMFLLARISTCMEAPIIADGKVLCVHTMTEKIKVDPKTEKIHSFALVLIARLGEPDRYCDTVYARCNDG